MWPRWDSSALAANTNTQNTQIHKIQIHKIHKYAKYTNKDTRLGYCFSLLTPEGRLDVGRRRCKKTVSIKSPRLKDSFKERPTITTNERKRGCNSSAVIQPFVPSLYILSSLLPPCQVCLPIISNVLKVLCTSLNPPRDPIPSHPIQPSCSTMVLHISMTIDGFLKLKSWFSFRTEIVQ